MNDTQLLVDVIMYDLGVSARIVGNEYKKCPLKRELDIDKSSRWRIWVVA